MDNNKLSTADIKTGGITRVMIAPYGQWSGMLDGKEITQNVNKEAYENLADELASNPREILVDLDHKSENPTEEGQDTKAMAWASDLMSDDDGIYANFKWTPAGVDSVAGRQYRYVSPTWILDNAGTPVKLLRIALTNRPNFTSLKPITNSQTEDKNMENEDKKEDEVKDVKEVKEVANEVTPEVTPEAEPVAEAEVTLEEVVAQLGLDAEATMADVSKAVADLQAKLAAYADAEALAQANAECDKVLDENKELVKNTEAFRAIYVKNSDIAMAVLATLNAPKSEDKVVLNSAPDKTCTVIVQDDLPVKAKKVCNSDNATRPIQKTLRSEMDELNGQAKLDFIKKHTDALALEMGSGTDD